MIEKSLYPYIWHTSRKGQLRICVLIAFVAPLAMAPLELQRRIVDHAVAGHAVWMLFILGVAYLAVILVQGGLKYLLNVTKGQVLEEVSRDLRRRILDLHAFDHSSTTRTPLPLDEGTTVSVLAAEAEDIGSFASESLAVPLLQGATIVWVLAYLIWVEPRIAALAIVVYAPQAILVPRIQRRINRLVRRKTSLVRKLGRDAVAHTGEGDAEGSARRRRAGVFIQQIFRTRLLIYRSKFFLTFLGNFLDSLGPLVVLVVGGYLVIQGKTEVSTLVVFISGFQKLSDPWDQLVNFYRSVSTARVAYGLVADVLGVEARYRKSETAAAP